MEKLQFQENAEISCRSLVYLIKNETRVAQKKVYYRDLQTKSEFLSSDVRKALFAQILSSYLPEHSENIVDMFKKETSFKKKAVDILIITIKQPELIGTQVAFNIDPLSKEDLDIDGLRIWEKTIESDTEGQLKIAMTMIGTAGNVSCSAACSKLFSNIESKLCILVGICAGLKNKVKIGDVVAAEMILDYESGRRTKDKFEKRPNPYRLDHIIERSLGYFNPDLRKWKENFFIKIKELKRHVQIIKLREKWIPNYDTGIILSGEKLIVDGSLPEMREEYHEKVRGAEMEGSGFASICKEHTMPWLIFRGVSDYGDPGKRTTDKWQPVASLAAAIVAHNYLSYNYRKKRDETTF